MSFEVRLAALLLLMAVVAGIERWRRGAAATRWHEYSFVVFAGLVGALCGLLFDQGTVTLSPEYFVLGKGLEPGQGLRARVALLGAQAGFAAGAVAGCVLLVVCGQREHSYRRLLVAGLWAPGVGLLLAPVVGALFAALDPWDYGPVLRETLSPEACQWFLTVWGLHTGLYLGAGLGLAIACWRARGSGEGRARQEPLE